MIDWKMHQSQKYKLRTLLKLFFDYPEELGLARVDKTALTFIRQHTLLLEFVGRLTRKTEI